MSEVPLTEVGWCETFVAGGLNGGDNGQRSPRASSRDRLLQRRLLSPDDGLASIGGSAGLHVISRQKWLNSSSAFRQSEIYKPL